MIALGDTPLPSLDYMPVRKRDAPSRFITPTEAPMTPAPITSARGRRSGISVNPGRRSLHDDCPGHALAADVTVKLAVVRIGAGLGETLLKLRPGCQDRRAERPIVGDDLMAALVDDPFDSRPNRHSDLLGSEGEICRDDGRSPRVRRGRRAARSWGRGARQRGLGPLHVPEPIHA